MKHMKFLLFILCAGTVSALHGAIYELLPNGGMEKVKDGTADGWFMLMRQKGMLSVTSDAHRGKSALEIRTGNAVAPDTVIPFSGADAGGRGGYPCVPGGIYRMKATIRSSNFARIKLYLNFRDGGGGFLCGRMSPVFSTVDEWREYSWVFHAPDNEVRKVGCGIIILSPENSVRIDSVSLSYDTEENPGRRDIYRKNRPQETNLELRAPGHDILVDGKASKTLREGLHTLLVHADSTRRLAFSSAKYPILERRWKIAKGKHPEAIDPQYDDSAWDMAEFHPDGSVRFPGDGEYTLRQVILWNATHHGGWKLLLGTTEEYALPAGALDSLFCALYSPLRHGMKKFQCVFELPPGFRIADMTKKPIRNHRLSYPVDVMRERLQDRVRYTISYPDQRFGQSGYTLVPLVAPQVFEGSPSLLYYRTGNGNFTELPVRIPIKTLPPIPDSGRSSFAVQGYEDGMILPVSEEHAALHYRQARKIGLNRHFMSPEENLLSRVFLKEIPYGELVYGIPGSFPMTLKFWGAIPDSVTSMIAWVGSNPEAKVRFLNGFPEALYQRDAEHNIHYGALCPSFVNGKGKKAYQKEIIAVMRREMLRHPGLKRVFIDWEYSPLRNQQQGIWCFCRKCREAFQKENGLKEIPVDSDIIRKYKKEWMNFRSGQDARTVGTISEALKKIGMDVLFYSQEHPDARWKLEGCVPEIFATVPGNSPASRHKQKFMDRQSETLCRTSKVPLMIAQRFARLGPARTQDGWKTMTVCSMDGVHQDLELWKIQILRMLASCRGGVDIQNALYYPAGSLYYMALAMQAVKPYEAVIREGIRADALFSSGDIAYPDAIAIRGENRILLFLFNETDQSKSVTFELLGIGRGNTMKTESGMQKLSGTDIHVDIPAMDARILLFQ